MLRVLWFSCLSFQTMDELKYSLWCTTMELEATRLAAQEEIRRKEEEIKQLKESLNRAIKEREATQKYGSLLRQQLPAPAPDDDRKSEESIVCESPVSCIEAIGPLPEKGKLLQAVMKAGPLLQTLLLAGPLPQWRQPPPPLTAIEIPPVTMQADDRPMNIAGQEKSLMSNIDGMEEDPYIVYTSLNRESEAHKLPCTSASFRR